MKPERRSPLGGVSEQGKMGIREQKKERTLDAIIRVSERQFQKNGVAGTSIDEIASEAFVSRKTIYNYISTKEDIVVEIVNRRLSAWLSNTRDHASWNGNTKEKIIYIYRNLAKEFKKEKKLWMEIMEVDGFNYLRHYSQRTITHDLMKCFKEIIETGQEEGVISRAFSPDVLAWHLNSVQITICREWAMSWPTRHSLSKRLLGSLELFFHGAAI